MPDVIDVNVRQHPTTRFQVLINHISLHFMQGRHIARGSTPSLFALSSRYTCRDITLLYSFRALSLFDLRRSPSLSSSPLLLAASLAAFSSASFAAFSLA